MQHSPLLSHLLLWVCTPPSEPRSPVRSSANSSSPCTPITHKRCTFSLAAALVNCDCFTTGKGITRNNSHFLCIPVEISIPPFEQKRQLHPLCGTRKLFVVSIMFHLLWAWLVQDLSQLIMCLQRENSWHALFQLPRWDLSL